MELTEDEKKQILLSDKFQKFFNRASRVMERALFQNESADIFIDYTGEKEDLDKYVLFDELCMMYFLTIMSFILFFFK